MNSNTTFEILYLEKKYIELGITDNENINFNPNIIPGKGYIPLCSVCKSDFELFKKNKISHDMEIECNHLSSCLWYDYFISKVKQTCKTAKIVRKKK
jgi:hypothetical protein